MANRISLTALTSTFIAFLTVGFLAHADTALVSYNFDYDVLDSGPDTYQVFQFNKAKAEISQNYAAGGYASAHLIDAAGDKNFVELQGYFQEQLTGKVRFRFKLLIANEQNLFNVALVGRSRYRLVPHGLQFWLLYEQGWFKHKTDSIPKKLFQPNLFEWYTVEALIDLDEGEYSLQISTETGELLTTLTQQPMAAGKHDHYSLKEYSFVGDLDDTEPSDFYIDDIHISTSNSAKLPSYVAPGRRKYFYEIWNDYHRQLQGKLSCLPARSLSDFDIDEKGYGALATKGQLDTLYQMIRTEHADQTKVAQHSLELLAVRDWMLSCQHLSKGEFSQARATITAALDMKPNATLFQLTDLIIAAASNPKDSGLYSRALALPHTGDDLRHQIVLSMLAFHNQRYADAGHPQQIQAALSWIINLKPDDIQSLQQLGLQALSENYVLQLQHLMPDRWEPHRQWMLMVEQQYYSYLWQERYSDAYTFANRITKALAKHGIAPGIWLEREADGTFMARDFDKALDLYNLQAPLSLGSLLKMADMYHLQGELAAEKSIRESIYKNFAMK